MTTMLDFSHLRNLAMREMLERGKAIDISACERTEEGDYILPPELWEAIDAPPYPDICDAAEDTWVWSVGENVDTGQIEASTSPAKHYERAGWRCLWLR